jgi:hypothetical protein
MSSQPGQPNPQLQQAQQMFSSLSQGRKIVLIASVVGLIISFFSWYGVTASLGGYSASGSENGWHGWALLAVLLFIVAGAWMLLPLFGISLRGVTASLPPSITEPKLVMGFGIVATLAVLLFMLTEGHGVSGTGISAGPSFGAYIGLICAVAIAVGGYLMQKEPSTA